MLHRIWVFLKLFFALFIIFLLYTVSTPSSVTEQVDDESSELLQNDLDELRNIKEFFDTEEPNNEFTDLFIDKFYGDAHDSSIANDKNKIKNLSKIMENYIQRYVNLFLKGSELSSHKCTDKNEIIKANLEITITGEELSFLQNYGNPKKPKSLSTSSLQRDLSKLDSIMSKIINVKEKNYFHQAGELYKNLFSLNLENLFSMSSLVNPYILIFFITIFSVYAVSPSISSNKFLYAVFVAINNIILYESFWNYQRKLREAEMSYAQALEKPESCDLSKRTWYHNFLNYFREEPCDVYYRNLLKNPAEEISLLQSVIDNYAFYFIEKPLQIFGKSTHALAKQYTSEMPWLLRCVLQILVVHSVAIMGILVILILCGMHIRFSFFGASIQMAKVQSSDKKSETETLEPLTSSKTTEKAVTS